MESPQKFTISEIEINRRKKAFSSLILSLFISVSVSLKLFLDLPYLLLFLSMIVLASFLFISRLLMEKAFNSFGKIIVHLTDEYIERITYKGNEKIYFRDIDTISIKKTIRKNIREIKIVTKERQLYLNGIVNINNFSEALEKLVNQDVKITQRQEVIDYDSKFFYPILGLLVGSGAIFLFIYVIDSSSQSVRILLSSFMVFVIGLGGYFVFTKPISKSHGLRFKVIDLIIGIIFIMLGVGLLYFILH